MSLVDANQALSSHTKSLVPSRGRGQECHFGQQRGGHWGSEKKGGTATSRVAGCTRRHPYMRHGPLLDPSHPETSDASWREEKEAQKETKILQGWQLCRVHPAWSSVGQWRHTESPLCPRPSPCGPTTAHHPPVRGHLVSVHCAPGTI